MCALAFYDTNSIPQAEGQHDTSCVAFAAPPPVAPSGGGGMLSGLGGMVAQGALRPCVQPGLHCLSCLDHLWVT